MAPLNLMKHLNKFSSSIIKRIISLNASGVQVRERFNSPEPPELSNLPKDKTTRINNKHKEHVQSICDEILMKKGSKNINEKETHDKTATAERPPDPVATASAGAANDKKSNNSNVSEPTKQNSDPCGDQRFLEGQQRKAAEKICVGGSSGGKDGGSGGGCGSEEMINYIESSGGRTSLFSKDTLMMHPEPKNLSKIEKDKRERPWLYADRTLSFNVRKYIKKRVPKE